MDTEDYEDTIDSNTNEFNNDHEEDPEQSYTRPKPQRASWVMPIIGGLLIILILVGTVLTYLYYSKKNKDQYEYIPEEDGGMSISDKELRKLAEDAYVKGYTYENEQKKDDTSTSTSNTSSTSNTKSPPEEKIDTSNIRTSGKFTDDPLVEIAADIAISTLVEGIAKRTIPLLKKAAIPVAKFSLQARNILSLAKSVSRSRVAIKALAKKLIERLTKTAGKEVVDAVATKMATEVLESSLKQASVTAGTAVASAGARTATTAGVNTVKAAVEVAETAGKVAAKTGIKGMFNLASLAKALKPSPMMLLTIFSIGLDVADVGGYNKMQTVAGMMKLKDEVDKEMKKTFIEEFKKIYEAAEKERQEKIAKGEIKAEDNPPIVFKESEVDIPPLLNPINDMKEEDIEAFIDSTIEKILDPKNNNALGLPIRKAIEKDLNDKVIKLSDVEDVGTKEYKIVNQDLLVRYASLLDTEELELYLYSELCKSRDGVLTGDGICTYSKEKCHSLYTWPLPEPKKDKDGKEIDDPNAPTYSEFKNGKCQIANSYIRTTCDENKLKYNFETGMCEISKSYCESKGGEWRYNDQIKKNDCLIPAEQQVIEFLLGTTITRGLKQLFDPDQYESCGFDGEFKIRGKCVDLPEGKTDIGIKPRTWDCNNSSAQKFFYDNRSRMIYSMKDYGKCFDTEGGTLNKGEKIILSNCDVKDSKQFIYDEKTKLMVARKDKTKCIGMNENTFSSGNHHWKHTSLANDSSCLKNWTYYEPDGQTIIQNNIKNITNPKGYHVWSIENGMVKNMNYEKCLSYDSKDKTSLEKCDNTSTNQRWIYNPMDKKLKHTSTEKCLQAVKDSSGKMVISTATCSSDNKQQWDNPKEGQLINVAEPQCLSVESDGARLRLADCRSDDQKYWCATKRDEFPPNDIKFELVDCDARDKNQLFELKRNDLRNLGLSCDYWRVGDCPPSYTNNGGTCGRGDSRIAVGAGRPADCPDGYTNQGLFCQKSSGDGTGRVAECPKGYFNSGSRCEHKAFGRGGGWAKINGGISRCENGKDSISDKPGKGNCEGWGAYYYPKCQYLAKRDGYAHADKWTNDACCMCSPEWGYKSFTFSEVAVCRDDEFLNKTLGRCYKKCPHGGTNTGFGTCTLGASHMKCNSDEFLNENLGRCYKICPDGYTNTGVECYRPVSVLGASHIKCNDDFEVKGSGLFAGYCYPKLCPPGYISKGGGSGRFYNPKEMKDNMNKATKNTDTSACYKPKMRTVALSLDYNPENDDTIGMPPSAEELEAPRKSSAEARNDVLTRSRSRAPPRRR